VSAQSLESSFDELVKSLLSRHPGESRGPEHLENTGFRVKPGMTKQGKIDFLRDRQFWLVLFRVPLSFYKERTENEEKFRQIS